MAEKSRYDRRQFIGAAAMTIAATQLRESPHAAAASTRFSSSLANSSFGPVKQIQAGLLNVGGYVGQSKMGLRTRPIQPFPFTEREWSPDNF